MDAFIDFLMLQCTLFVSSYMGTLLVWGNHPQRTREGLTLLGNVNAIGLRARSITMLANASSMLLLACLLACPE
jgi:hypothetical protein